MLHDRIDRHLHVTRLLSSDLPPEARAGIAGERPCSEKSSDFKDQLRCGALGGTRTPTVLPTATSRQRVYQFRHERLGYRMEPRRHRRIDGAM